MRACPCSAPDRKLHVHHRVAFSIVLQKEWECFRWVLVRVERDFGFVGLACLSASGGLLLSSPSTGGQHSTAASFAPQAAAAPSWLVREGLGRTGWLGRLAPATAEAACRDAIRTI